MPKKNVYVSEELDELIRTHEGPVPLSEIMRVAVEQYLGQGMCPTCRQPVRIVKSKTTTTFSVKQMQKMPWAELKEYGRGIGADMTTRKRSELIASIQECL